MIYRLYRLIHETFPNIVLSFLVVDQDVRLCLNNRWLYPVSDIFWKFGYFFDLMSLAIMDPLLVAHKIKQDFAEGISCILLVQLSIQLKRRLASFLFSWFELGLIWHDENGFASSCRGWTELLLTYLIRRMPSPPSIGLRNVLHYFNICIWIGGTRVMAEQVPLRLQRRQHLLVTLNLLLMRLNYFKLIQIL